MHLTAVGNTVYSLRAGAASDVQLHTFAPAHRRPNYKRHSAVKLLDTEGEKQQEKERETDGRCDRALKQTAYTAPDYDTKSTTTSHTTKHESTERFNVRTSHHRRCNYRCNSCREVSCRCKDCKSSRA